jgi:hypothetical protein
VTFVPSRKPGTRPQLDWKKEYSVSVFVNAPFDKEYVDLFDALIFVMVCCGFLPRSAIETSGGIPRIDRILNALTSSKYSLHDLSRCRGEGEDNLARFNMPLELGMAMCLRHLDNAAHEWFVVVPRDHDYRNYVSDLAGFDLEEYAGTVETVVQPVMSWLLSLPEAPPAVGSLTPGDVLVALPNFQQAASDVRKAWSGTARWSRLVRTAIKHAPIRLQPPAAP